MTGKQSLLFDKDVYVRCTATVVGKKEADGPLGEMFDVAVEDDMFGKKSWEEAESHIQEMAVDKLLIKSGMAVSDIDYIYAGDLLGQLIATSFGLMKYEVPMFGLYGACSTMGEALSLGAMCVNAGYAQNVIAIASSHFASAEKQFRYPLEYGNQRPIASTWTVTGAGAYIVGDKPLDKKKCVLIKGITTGKIVDYGVKDSMNMGACMAPAAAELIEANFKDLDIFSAFSQCRQFYGYQIDTIEQVFTKSVFAHHLTQVGIRSRNHPDIRLTRATVSQHLKGLVLQYPQQLYLARRIEVPDFIQKNSSFVRHFKTPHTVGSGICKRTFFMTEHFTFEKAL